MLPAPSELADAKENVGSGWREEALPLASSPIPPAEAEADAGRLLLLLLALLAGKKPGAASGAEADAPADVPPEI